MIKKIIILIFCLYFTSLTALAVNHLSIVGLRQTNFVVTDSLGRQTGYDITTKQQFSQIPKGKYKSSGFGESFNSPDNDDFYELVILDPMDGIYKIKVIGNKLKKINLVISYDQPLVSPEIPAISYFSDVNKVDYFEINYIYATGIAGNIIPVARIVSASTLIDDINVMQKMDYIGSSEFVSEITNKINKIEEKRLKPAEKEDDKKLTPTQKAKKEYTELLNEITEKYNKPEGDEFVKQEAYTVLREDMEYIIGHLQ